MTVAILIICHDNIARTLVETASSILANQDLPVTTLSIPSGLEPQSLGFYADQVRGHIVDSNTGQGVLILTDICGATPNNLAKYFADEKGIKVISGLNLPMLVRVLNYQQSSIDQLAEIALQGGLNGIKEDA